MRRAREGESVGGRNIYIIGDSMETQGGVK